MLLEQMAKYWWILTLAVVLILLAILGYFIFQNQQLIKQLSTSSPSPQISSPLPSPSPAPSSPSPSPTPSSEVLRENIEAAINSKNTAALVTFMTNTVQVILQATECCGPMTPTEAESQLSYISEGTPFNFNQTDPTIVNLKNKNPELAGQFIGISKNQEHLIALNINSQNKIDSIRMSVSWKLFSL